MAKFKNQKRDKRKDKKHSKHRNDHSTQPIRGNPNYHNQEQIHNFLLREGENAVANKIFNFLSEKNIHQRYSSREIAKHFNYSDEDLPGFWNVLHSLFDKHYVEKNQDREYSITELGNAIYKEGGSFSDIKQEVHKKDMLTVGENYDGTILLKKENLARVLLRNHPKMEVKVEYGYFLQAFDKDKVSVKIITIPTEKEPYYLAKVTEVISRYQEEFIGRVEKKKKIFQFFPDNGNQPYTFFVKLGEHKKAEENDKVILSDLTFAGNGDVFGKVKQVLGVSGDPTVEISSLLMHYNIDATFPKSVLNELNKIPAEISTEEVATRKDFRSKKVFTIDPIDAKDFDDAFSVEKIGDEYEIGVHIADVSHFVTKNTHLDNEAQERATSVYLVDKVIPMLPSRLCEDLCSLNPNTDRFAYSVIFRMNKHAEVLKYEIAKTVIHSHRRFHYEEAFDILQAGKGDLFDELTILNQLAHILTKNRMRDGSIDLDSEEWKFELDEKGTPITLKLKRRLDTHRLVEEFMLLTNRTVCQHIYDYYQSEDLNYPAVYRIHDGPNPDKIVALANFVKTLGYQLPLYRKNGLFTASAQSLQSLLSATKGSPVESLVSELTLRSMSKAIYSPKNIGHFGLGFEYYTHFTSPIRRYPDLITHRLLFEYETARLKDKILTTKSIEKLSNEVSIICEKSSQQEKNAAEAERKSIRIKQVEYIQKFVGKTFEGIVSDVLEYGMHVKLVGIGIEGFVHIRKFREDDYYLFDKKQHAIIGRKNKEKYQIGKNIKVRLASVDPLKYRIDFELVAE